MKTIKQQDLTKNGSTFCMIRLVGVLLLTEKSQSISHHGMVGKQNSIHIK